jgi:hypothetical protein
MSAVKITNRPLINRLITNRNCAEISFNNDDIVVLFSYDRAVAAIINRSQPAANRINCVIEEVPSKTTQKHINMFMEVYGFRDIKPVLTTSQELFDLMNGK